MPLFARAVLHMLFVYAFGGCAEAPDEPEKTTEVDPNDVDGDGVAASEDCDDEDPKVWLPHDERRRDLTEDFPLFCRG